MADPVPPMVLRRKRPHRQRHSTDSARASSESTGLVKELPDSPTRTRSPVEKPEPQVAVSSEAFSTESSATAGLCAIAGHSWVDRKTEVLKPGQHIDLPGIERRMASYELLPAYSSTYPPNSIMERDDLGGKRPAQLESWRPPRDAGCEQDSQLYPRAASAPVVMQPCMDNTFCDSIFLCGIPLPIRQQRRQGNLVRTIRRA